MKYRGAGVSRRNMGDVWEAFFYPIRFLPFEKCVPSVLSRFSLSNEDYVDRQTTTYDCNGFVPLWVTTVKTTIKHVRIYYAYGVHIHAYFLLSSPLLVPCQQIEAAGGYDLKIIQVSNEVMK